MLSQKSFFQSKQKTQKASPLAYDLLEYFRKVAPQTKPGVKRIQETIDTINARRDAPKGGVDAMLIWFLQNHKKPYMIQIYGIPSLKAKWPRLQDAYDRFHRLSEDDVDNSGRLCCKRLAEENSNFDASDPELFHAVQMSHNYIYEVRWMLLEKQKKAQFKKKVDANAKRILESILNDPQSLVFAWFLNHRNASSWSFVTISDTNTEWTKWIQRQCNTYGIYWDDGREAEME